MRILETSGWGASRTEKTVALLEGRRLAGDERTARQAERIVRKVRRDGDAALARYAQALDGHGKGRALLVPKSEMSAALESLAAPVRSALELAAENIAQFARQQLPMDFDMDVASGVSAGQRVRPLDSVGCYVPSGRYPLPSTLLMTAVPAKIAGVKRIVVVSPKPSQETLAAAVLLGIQEFYAIGGAHAIAALAYGTESIAGVNKIVGPGNRFVTAAKKIVSADCAIDMLAGPTEIGVVSETGDAGFIAADLVAQSEHDADAFAVLITTNKKLAKSVVRETKRQARKNALAARALAKHGYVLLAATLEEARGLANRLAFEHLTVDQDEDVGWVRNAGSVFVGKWSAQAFGDYVSGPNHTLPTSGSAKVRGGLSVLDFVKLITVQRYARVGVEALGRATVILAEAEGLTGHAQAVRVRLTDG